ncbi:MAG: Fe-S-containing hydro-lyase [Lentisphaeria bacterium]|jgi:fumarate hydratase subunit beta|nr:Fe-S-containing hydro-lyase [Lentisphaeria bacterium]MBQ8754430.1 Fe-S-containing hydro-lyase [Lentisphaeria bacterium]
MNSAKKVILPLTENDARKLKAGDRLLLNGVIWTARDAAHKRLVAMLDAGETLPVDLNDQLVYFVGPCPAPPGRAIGSAGPTTSGRMDAYSPRLIRECGLRGMIGKGNRSQAVIDAMKEKGAVYLAATGGAGALIAQCIEKCDLIAFPELGPEAIYRLEVKDFPVVVAIDSEGNTLYA